MPPNTIDTNSHGLEKDTPLNGGASFSRGNRLFRLLWNTTWLLLASWTPPPLHSWRRFLLRLFGAKIGFMSDVRGSARVWNPRNLIMGDRAIIAENAHCYNQALISIGDRTIISQKAYLCASGHDVDDPGFVLIKRPITIGKGAWVATDAFVGPGSVIEDGAVLGARAVCVGTLAEYTIYVGNPARRLRKRGAYGDQSR